MLMKEPSSKQVFIKAIKVSKALGFGVKYKGYPNFYRKVHSVYGRRFCVCLERQAAQDDQNH